MTIMDKIKGIEAEIESLVQHAPATAAAQPSLAETTLAAAEVGRAKEAAQVQGTPAQNSTPVA